MVLPLPCPKNNCLTVIFMDAGQGDATLIVFPDNSLILVDCGSAKNKQLVSKEISTVLNAYLGQTQNELKALVLTHPDMDHYNLVKPLIINKQVKIDTVYYSGTPSDYTLNSVDTWLKKSAMKNGNPLVKKVVEFSAPAYDVAHPVTALSYKSTQGTFNVDTRILAAGVGPKSNDNSIVLLLTYLNFNIFLMGDATKKTESYISLWNNNMNSPSYNVLTNLLNGKHTLLKVGHHGSTSSSTMGWLKLIKPEVAIISSDTKEFGGVSGSSIPDKEVIDRILQLNTIISYKNIHPAHHYVEYDKSTLNHQQVLTDRAMLTTLYLLKFAPNKTDFTSYGTSWYYTIAANSTTDWGVLVNPSVSWSNITTAY